MVLKLEFYDENKFNDFIKVLDEKAVAYDIIDKTDYKIDIYDLVKYCNRYRSLQFYVEFINKNGKLVHLDINENEIAEYMINEF
jgi:hypothetical protein